MKNERLKLFGCIFIILVTAFIIGGVMHSASYLGGDVLTSGYINDRGISLEESDPLLRLDGKEIAVTANITSTVNGDIVQLYHANARTAFKISKTNNSSNAVSITNAAYGGTFSNGLGKLSLPDGTYYFFGYDVTNGTTLRSGPVTVSGVCKDGGNKTNQTGSFSVEKCIYRQSNGSYVATSETNLTCASGYVWQNNKLSVTTDTCNFTSMNGLSRRYCKRVYSATCVKQQTTQPENPDPPKPVAAARLSSLSVSSGTLSPAFKSGTFKYNVTVGTNVSSIKVNATAASGSSFVSGSGPRTVNLNYGSNSIKIKVKNSAGAVVTYTVTVTRPDGRSTVNTLSNLKVSEGVLSPAFSPNVANYVVDVDNSVTSIAIDATLTDNSSTFASGFGPNTYSLEPGPNQLYVKVVSQKGATNVYNITVNRATLPSKCTTETGDLALLKQINLAVDIADLKLDQIEDFDPKQFTYNDIKVPYQVTNLTVEGYVETEGDTVVVEGADDLEVGETREVKITVTSKECPNFSNVYTLNVQRQPEVVKGDNAELSNITIENHDEFKFEPNVLKYNLILNRDEDKLGISYERVQDTTECNITGNEELGYSSEVVIRCVSEDGEDIAEYTITIDGVQKGTNIFFIIILVIIIILILIYLVLRLLGYRIYFNFGSLFRGMNEKVKNVFDN